MDLEIGRYAQEDVSLYWLMLVIQLHQQVRLHDLRIVIVLFFIGIFSKPVISNSL